MPESAMHRKLLLAAMLAASTPVSTSALAQIESREGIELQNQILELRQELQQLQQLQSQAAGEPAPPIGPPLQQGQGPGGGTSGGAGGGDPEIASQLVVRVSELEEQVRALQGKVDELTNQLQRQNDDLTKQIGDLSFKLGQGGGGGAPAQPAMPPAEDQGFAAPAAPGPAYGTPRLPPLMPAAPPTPRRTPELILKEGNAALARHDYAAAESAAQEVANAGGPHAADAQVLLARAQMGGHKYQASAASYYAVYSHAPKSPRAPEALLGVTDALLALGDRNDACQALAKLGSEFPHADPALRARAAAARKRAACH
jgi:TolA-binding protein